MKRLIYSAAAMAALICGACDKNDNGSGTQTPVTPPAPGEQAIAFATEIEGMTRAPQLDEDGSGSFTPGDTFTLYAHDNAGGEKALDYTIGASKLYWSELTFAAEGGQVGFAACYPKPELTDGGFDFTTSQEAAGDLLWASAAGVSVGTEEPVELTFRHAMHRLAVKYTVEDPTVDAAGIETRCTARATARIDLRGGRIELGDSRQTFSATGDAVRFLLLPQQTGEVTLEIRAGGTTKSWKLSETDFAYPELEGGKQVTVNLKIRNGQITLAGITIEGWGDQGTVDDEIIL